MARTKISEFSSTPANNTDIDSINIAEGCAPSNINDAIRELMAQLKDFQTGAVGDSFNGPIGSSTASTGAFTNITASGTLGVTGVATLGAGAILNTPASVTLTNATGLPISTGVSGLGTGVATALAVNVGSAGAPVVNGGALGTPSSGTVTNLTGTASININGTVGATTPTTGAFTTLAASSSVTLSGGTANGVAYLNGSKVLTSGSALTFDGNNLGVSGDIFSSGSPILYSYNGGTAGTVRAGIQLVGTDPSIRYYISGSEGMRLTSTGLGIGTSSPAVKLQVNSGDIRIVQTNNSANNGLYFRNAADSGTYAKVAYVASTGEFQVGTTDAYSLLLQTNNTTKATLDSAGNLGLGVTPSAWAGFTALQVKNSALWSDGNTAFLSANTYYSSGYKYIASAAASQYLQASGAHSWYTAASGTAGNAISFTQAMTLDASGNLGVGTTSPSSYGKLAVSGGNVHVIGQNYTTDAGGGFWASGASTYTVGWYESSGNMLFRTAGTERARIDSSGNLLVGKTATGVGTTGFAAKDFLEVTRDGNPVAYFTRLTSDGDVVQFRRSSGSAVGSISVTTTATAYNTSSDQRLKENIADADSASNLIDSLQVRKFDWRLDGSHQRYGFVAQELVTVAPEAVHQPADTEEMMAVDYSKLVPMLVKEIQSLRQRVAQLETN